MSLGKPFLKAALWALPKVDTMIQACPTAAVPVANVMLIQDGLKLMNGSGPMNVKDPIKTMLPITDIMVGEGTTSHSWNFGIMASAIHYSHVLHALQILGLEY